MEEAVVIERIDAFVFRCPIADPVTTSFGEMRDRPAVFVRVEAAGGAFGWGEIFANWPAAGAEHRANLLMMDIAPLVLGERFESPQDLFDTLVRKTHIRAIQCGEQGPFRQAIAGLDIALWDLFARRRGCPVRNLLGAASAELIPAYASGIDVRKGAATLAAARERGHTCFKVKVGFDIAADAAAVRTLAGTLRHEERLFADANQAWDTDQAAAFLEQIDGAPLGWLEEPIPVDAPQSDWQQLASRSTVPLAGGENIAGLEDFNDAIAAASLSILQPDVVKWGGITGCRAVAASAIAAGRTYCPHFLGGGIGLVASAHVLAAVGGSGLLEVDVNPNPLRDELVDTEAALGNGRWSLGGRPGLGIETLPSSIDHYQTLYLTRGTRTCIPVGTASLRSVG